MCHRSISSKSSSSISVLTPGLEANTAPFCCHWCVWLTSTEGQRSQSQPTFYPCSWPLLIMSFGSLSDYLINYPEVPLFRETSAGQIAVVSPAPINPNYSNAAQRGCLQHDHCIPCLVFLSTENPSFLRCIKFISHFNGDIKYRGLGDHLL